MTATDLQGNLTWQRAIPPLPGGTVTPKYVVKTPLCDTTTDACNDLIANASGDCVVVTTSTADIFGTLYTLDQSGNIVAQMPDGGAQISWAGNWYIQTAGRTQFASATPQHVSAQAASVSGSIANTFMAPIVFASSYWALVGGNESGSSVASMHYHAEIHWMPDAEFYWINDDNQTWPPQDRSHTLLTPVEIRTIKSDALQEARKAFDGYPGIRVDEGGDRTSYDIFDVAPTGTGTVSGSRSLGETPPGCKEWSGARCAPTDIYYEMHVTEAQTSSQDSNGKNTYPRSWYIHAIGRGIGRTIAHEFGHRYSLSGMHTGPANEYNTGKTDEPSYKIWFGTAPLVWGAETAQQLKNLVDYGNPNGPWWKQW